MEIADRWVKLSRKPAYIAFLERRLRRGERCRERLESSTG